MTPGLDPIWARAGVAGDSSRRFTRRTRDAFFPARRSLQRALRRRPQAHPTWSFGGPPFPPKSHAARPAQRHHRAPPEEKQTSRCTSPIIRKISRRSAAGSTRTRTCRSRSARGSTSSGRQPVQRAGVLPEVWPTGFSSAPTARRVKARIGRTSGFSKRSTSTSITFTSPTQGRWKIYGIGLPGRRPGEGVPGECQARVDAPLGDHRDAQSRRAGPLPRPAGRDGRASTFDAEVGGRIGPPSCRYDPSRASASSRARSTCSSSGPGVGPAHGHQIANTSSARPRRAPGRARIALPGPPRLERKRWVTSGGRPRGTQSRVQVLPAHPAARSRSPAKNRSGRS